MSITFPYLTENRKSKIFNKKTFQSTERSLVFKRCNILNDTNVFTYDNQLNIIFSAEFKTKII